MPRPLIQLDAGVSAYEYSHDCKWVLGERISDGSVVLRRIGRGPSDDIIVAMHRNCFKTSYEKNYFIGNSRSGYAAVFCDRESMLHIDLQTGKRNVYDNTSDHGLFIDKHTYVNHQNCTVQSTNISSGKVRYMLKTSPQVHVTFSSTGNYCGCIRRYDEVGVYKLTGTAYILCYTVNVSSDTIYVNDNGYLIVIAEHELHTIYANGLPIYTNTTSSYVAFVSRSANLIALHSEDYSHIWKLSDRGDMKFVCTVCAPYYSDKQLADDGLTLLVYGGHQKACALFTGRWSTFMHSSNAVCRAISCRAAIREAVRCAAGNSCEILCEAIFEADGN